MSRWSNTAPDERAVRASTRGGVASPAPAPAATRAVDLPFDAPPERPATIPSRAAPDPRRTLNLETSPTRLDLAIEWLLTGLLAFMPLALGVVAPWSETVVVAVAAAIALCLALRVALHRHGAAGGRRFSWSWAYVPMLLFVAVAAAQLWPLPAAAVRAVSPQTLALKAELLASAPDGTAAAAAERTTLSFYPYAAARDLRLVAVAATLFVAVVNTFHRASQVKRLLTAVAAVGGAVAVLALLQVLTGTERIYWLIPTTPDSGGARSGPFVNHSHYAQFINLSVGAAAALLLVRLREELPRNLSPSQVFDRLQDHEFRGAWWLVGVVLAGTLTVFLSLSRGGVVAMIAAAGFTALALVWRRGVRGGAGWGWALTVLGLFVFMGLLYGGFDVVAERLASLRTADDPSSGRAQVYKDVAVAARRFPLLGMGLGAWAVTYPMFDRSTNPYFAEYADSDYAQAVLEVGAVGLAVVLLFAAVVWVNYFRATASRRDPLCAAAFGLAFGLMAATVHAATDYGQHMPAVAGLTAVTCGLLVCLGHRAAAAAKQDRAEKSEKAPKATRLTEPSDAAGPGDVAAWRGRTGWASAAASLVLPLGLLAGLGWALLSVNRVRAAEHYNARAEAVAARLEADGWDGGNDDYVALIRNAAAASELQPRNAEYRYRLAAYRWRSISRTTDPETGDLLMSGMQLNAAERIVGDLHAARPLCPTYGPLLSLAGQLEMLVLDRPEQGAEHVRLGQRLAPTDPAATFAAATVDATEGRWDESLSKFCHCLALSPGMITDVLAVYTAAERPDLALQVAGDNPTYLLRLAKMAASQEAHADTAQAAEDRFVALLSDPEQQAKAPPGMLPGMLYEAAVIFHKRGNHAPAIPLYQKAIARDYNRADWRLLLARCLAAEGRTEEAMREARLCLRLKPQWPEARALVEELSVRPKAAPAPSRRPATEPAGRVEATPG